MKTKNIIPLLLFLIIASCSTQEKKIKENAMPYIEAMAEYDIDAAYNYATPETQRQTLDYIKHGIMPYLDSSYIKQNTPAKIKLDSIVMESDTVATIYYRKSTPIQKNSPATLQVRQREGEWMVHQLINHAPLIGGSFSVADTAAMKNNPRNSAIPRKIVKATKE